MDTLGLLIDDAKKKKKPWQNYKILPDLQPPPLLPSAKKVNAIDNANTKKSGGTGILPETLTETAGTRTYWSNYVYYVSMSGLSVLVSKPIKSVKFVDPATGNFMTLNYVDTSNNQALNINQGLPPSIP